MVSVREIADDDPRDLLFCSKLGIVKRTPLSAYKNIRAGGLIAAGVAEDDVLCVVRLLNPEDDVDIMILTGNGQCIRFPKAGPKGAPVYGRTARGNKGITLISEDVVVDMLLVPESTRTPSRAATERASSATAPVKTSVLWSVPARSPPPIRSCWSRIPAG